MGPIKNVSIPTPCHQSWQQMQPVETGRHCNACAKTVIDFTKMTDDEVIALLSAGSDICGRFNQLQLNGVNQRARNENPAGRSVWKSRIAAISLFGSGLFLNACGQTNSHHSVPTEQGQTRPSLAGMVMGKAVMPDSLRRTVIKGWVTDENNRPLAGAIVSLVPGSASTQTDSAGEFMLQAALNAKEIKISRLGFIDTRMAVNAGAAIIYRVKLQEELVMGKVLVVKSPFFKRGYNKCIKKITRIVVKDKTAGK